MKNILWIKPPMQTAVGFTKIADAVKHIEKLVGNVTDCVISHNVMFINEQEWGVYMGNQSGEPMLEDIPATLSHSLLNKSNVYKKIGDVKIKTVINTLSRGILAQLRNGRIRDDDFEGTITFLLSLYMKSKDIPADKRRRRLKELNEILRIIRKK